MVWLKLSGKSAACTQCYAGFLYIMDGGGRGLVSICTCSGPCQVRSGVWCGNVLFAGGLVQAASFSVLPDVGAGAAASAVFASMAPLLVAIWKQPSPAHFASCTALASLNRCPLFTGNAIAHGMFYASSASVDRLRFRTVRCPHAREYN